MSSASRSAIFLGFALLTTLGAGCWNKAPSNLPATQKQLSLPKLDITSPGLSAATPESNITISGTTDQGLVWFGDKYYAVKEGKFEQIVDLTPGANRIPVSVGNTMATTTINVTIERMVSATTTSDTVKPAETAPAATIVAPAQNKTTAVAPAAKKTATKIAAPATVPTPAATAPAVQFVSGELGLTVSLMDGNAYLSWGRAAEPFQTYVIVKSTTDMSPYFPKIFWTTAINNIDVRQWIDRNVAAKSTTAYRVCKLRPDQSIACGNAAKVTKP